MAGLHTETLDGKPIPRRDRVTFHCLRHTAGTWLAETGASAFEVQAFMRHATIKQSLGYVHISADAVTTAADKLGLPSPLRAVS